MFNFVDNSGVIKIDIYLFCTASAPDTYGDRESKALLKTLYDK